MSDITVEYVGHACLLIAAGDERIITDPWFTNPVMANSWYHVPRYSRDIEALPRLDYIYVSHEHADHLDIPALRRLTPTATIVIPAYGDGKMERALAEAGLPHKVVALVDGQEFKTRGGATIAIYAADTGSKDSSLVVARGNTCVYNHTDNWITPAKMKRIGQRWQVDVAFQCYAGVGSFPSYMLWPLDYRVQRGQSKKTQLFQRMKEAVEALRPGTIVPFGASFGYLRPETLWLNDVCATNPTECREWLQANGVTIPVTLMDHGDLWTKERGVHPGAVRHSTAIDAKAIAEYAAFHAKTIERKRNDEAVDPKYLTLNDTMLGDYLRAWIDADRERLGDLAITVQFSISGANGVTWTADIGRRTVTKSIPALPNLFLSMTDTELFNGLVHRGYTIADLYLSSRIQMNRYPYDAYYKTFFDSFFWWDEGQQVRANQKRADALGGDWRKAAA